MSRGRVDPTCSFRKSQIRGSFISGVFYSQLFAISVSSIRLNRTRFRARISEDESFVRGTLTSDVRTQVHFVRAMKRENGGAIFIPTAYSQLSQEIARSFYAFHQFINSHTPGSFRNAKYYNHCTLRIGDFLSGCNENEGEKSRTQSLNALLQVDSKMTPCSRRS